MQFSRRNLVSAGKWNMFRNLSLFHNICHVVLVPRLCRLKYMKTFRIPYLERRGSCTIYYYSLSPRHFLVYSTPWYIPRWSLRVKNNFKFSDLHYLMPYLSCCFIFIILKVNFGISSVWYLKPSSVDPSETSCSDSIWSKGSGTKIKAHIWR